jgi:uncharacterized protein
VLLIDVNLLVYAWDIGSPHHAAARAWLDASLSESGRVALPWESTLGFIRIVTNPRIYERPAAIARAWSQVTDWLNCGNVWIPHATEEHSSILGGLMKNLGGGSTLVPDAHLAALAIGHGLILCSSDGDFARFSGLRWLNPLKS